jgi:hypothetical protein
LMSSRTSSTTPTRQIPLARTLAEALQALAVSGPAAGGLPQPAPAEGILG